MLNGRMGIDRMIIELYVIIGTIVSIGYHRAHTLYPRNDSICAGMSMSTIVMILLTIWYCQVYGGHNRRMIESSLILLASGTITQLLSPPNILYIYMISIVNMGIMVAVVSMMVLDIP